MKKFRVLAAALAASAFLAGCGGSDPGDQTPRVAYGHMVNFGDSLSDVGTYRVSFVEAAGGGYYSINGDTSASLPYTNWTEYLAATLALTAPCAAETGLDTVQGVGLPPAVPPEFHEADGCLNYAQGGARVTDPHGPGNNYYYFNFGDPSGVIGQLTVPVTTQIDNFLAHNADHKFAADDLVTVFAGGNDLFIQIGVEYKLLLLGGATPEEAATAIVTNMAHAGGEEAAYIKAKILAQGATRVVAINLPDVSLTPYAIEAEAENPGTQALVLNMAQAFNAQLAAGLEGTEANVLQVDLYTASQAQSADPAQYGLTNVTEPACDMTIVSSSLLCTVDTLIDAPDVQTHAFADGVHPTPYAYRLIAQLVSQQMALKGWL